MRKQRGLTMTGFITWAVVFIFVALFGFKVGPAYVEYYAIEKQLTIIANDPEILRTPTRGAVETAYARRTSIEDIRAVGPSDLLIEKDGDKLVISADYSVRVPLVGNMSACLDFHATSDKK
ncbi:MAG: DUF4845 domain-containing protein [Betaproteobacteria bacterium]|nr:DUF4845 domain-containing protein [Betaproteobacteria bacterium]